MSFCVFSLLLGHQNEFFTYPLEPCKPCSSPPQRAILIVLFWTNTYSFLKIRIASIHYNRNQQHWSVAPVAPCQESKCAPKHYKLLLFKFLSVPGISATTLYPFRFLLLNEVFTSASIFYFHTIFN